jgi:hypothetical protein
MTLTSPNPNPNPNPTLTLAQSPALSITVALILRLIFLWQVVPAYLIEVDKTGLVKLAETMSRVTVDFKEDEKVQEAITRAESRIGMLNTAPSRRTSPFPLLPLP